MIRPARRLSVLAATLASMLLAAVPAAEAATVHFTGPAGAEVSIDGVELGVLPLAPLELPVGSHEVRSQARGYEKLTQALDVSDPTAVMHVRLRMLPLRRSRAVTGSLLYAGLGQRYAGADLRGWVYFAGETIGLMTALGGELSRANEEDEYINAIRNYEAAVSAGQINRWRQEADAAYQNVQDMEDVRNTGLMIAGGAWLLSLLDAWLLTPIVDVGAGAVPPAAASLEAPRESPVGAHAAVTIAF